MKNTLHYLVVYLVMLATPALAQQEVISAASGWVKPNAAATPQKLPPLINWQTPQAQQWTTKQPKLTVSVCVQSDAPIQSIQFFHNGQPLDTRQRGFKQVTCGQEVSEDINLIAGANEVHVKATNVAGTTTSSSRYITYQAVVTPPPPPQKRLALIVANDKYVKFPLKNPVNDGKAVKQELENLGFTVLYKENLPLKELKKTFDSFMTDLSNQSVSLFYYAGHGLMVNGENFVQPVDADPASEPDVEYECYPLRRLIARMQQANPDGANLVFWDACRNNPYRSWRRGTDEPIFAPVQPAVGTVIIYATEPGKPAVEDDKNGLFTSELVKHMNVPNVDLFELVDRIDRGLSQRGIKQPPYIEGRLRGRFFFRKEG
ncbi:hypothetical protein GCM10023189_10530 [Nibrella saemangeumensis]|uniref:Caspase family p20 domain-containing protein n=1 Tax=Nibrella saemangeumensis TaxID=1084526 RepID=A0ABP8MIU4_9BACT